MSYVRWMPTGSQGLSASQSRLLDYRLARLEQQRVDYIQPLAANSPEGEVYEWVQQGASEMNGSWTTGAPPVLSIPFVIPTDESWLYIGFTIDAAAVLPALAGYSSLGNGMMELQLDGVAQYFPGFEAFPLGATYTATGPDWSQAFIGKTAGNPLTNFGYDLAPGAHTVSLTLVQPGEYIGAKYYFRNLALRGYVQA